MTATAFDPEAKEADDYDTANTHLKFKVQQYAMTRVGCSRRIEQWFCRNYRIKSKGCCTRQAFVQITSRWTSDTS